LGEPHPRKILNAVLKVSGIQSIETSFLGLLAYNLVTIPSGKSQLVF
jgi:hypothetical protein